MSTACVLVAAGSGSRLAAGRPKALVEVGGRPLLLHAAERALASGVLSELVVVAPPDRVGEVVALVAPLAGPGGSGAGAAVRVVPGGSTRQDSVRAGLAALAPLVDVVLVHDAARCLAPPALFAAVDAAVRSGAPAVVPGVPVADTIRSLAGAGGPGAVVDRELLRAVQTPQGFARRALEAAHAAVVSGDAAGASPAALAATDDATLVELAGAAVQVVPGAEEAFKVTRLIDLALAGALLAAGAA